MGFFMSQNSVSMIPFTDHCAQNVFIDFRVSTAWTVFSTQARNGQPMINPVVDFVLPIDCHTKIKEPRLLFYLPIVGEVLAV